MNSRIFASAAFAMLVVCGGVAQAQDFMAYEGKNSIHDGQGGNRKTVKDIDFWQNGDPPRRYQIVGQITDERHKTGLFGLISMSNLEPDIAKIAKANGGDAVILVAAQDEVTGIAGSSFGTANATYGNGTANAFGSGFGFSSAIKEHESRYVVIRYLPDAPAPATAPSSTGPQEPSTPATAPQ